jgi:hypothetical protein
MRSDGVLLIGVLVWVWFGLVWFGFGGEKAGGGGGRPTGIRNPVGRMVKSAHDCLLGCAIRDSG